MADGARPDPATLDEATLAFVGRVFALARGGPAATLRDLLGQGLPPNLRDGKGDSLLMLAAYHGQAETVRVLLEAWADPDLPNDRGQTPLAAAAFRGDAAVARLLLDRGAAVDARGEGGRTALAVAAMFDRVEIVRLLLAHGADPAAEDTAGLGPLNAALAMGAAGTPPLIAAALRERPAAQRPRPVHAAGRIGR